MKHVVIGTGLSSYSTVLGLLDNGVKPLVIDIGIDSNSDLSRLQDASSAIFAKKGLFDSHHMYKYPIRALGIELVENSETNFHLSGAIGGLSTVWGAGLQPLDLLENYKIPIKFREKFIEAQNELINKIPVSYIEDDIQKVYPWPKRSNGHTPFISKEFSKILNRYRNSPRIKKDLVIGRPRLAVRNDKSELACIKCGKCLTGCEVGSILNSGQEFKKLILSNSIEYVKGTVFELRNLSDKRIEVNFYDDDGKPKKIEADFLFLGLGPIATPILLIKSKMINRSIKVLDSQVFYIFIFKKLIIRFQEKFSLAQLILTNKKPDIGFSENKVSLFNLSLFEYSSDWDYRLNEKLVEWGLNIEILKRVLKKILRSIISGIGFIESDKSGYILVERDSNDKITVKGIQNPEIKRHIKGVLKYLSKNFLKIGLITLPINLNRFPIVGAGWHMGSGLPMGGCEELDWSGKLHGNSNIYVVDSTSLPSINPGSHTFSAMVNAYRIAKYLDY
jgi:hypothetical protein